jgi:excisionase family DNA binding protein
MTLDDIRSAIAPLDDTVTLSFTVAQLRGLVSAANAVTPDLHEPSDAGVDMTVVQVAKRFGRKASTIRTWCAAGELPGCYRNRGREWRIPASAVEAMQRRQQSEQKTTRPKREPASTTDLSAWRRHVRGSAS